MGVKETAASEKSNFLFWGSSWTGGQSKGEEGTDEISSVATA